MRIGHGTFLIDRHVHRFEHLLIGLRLGVIFIFLGFFLQTLIGLFHRIHNLPCRRRSIAGGRLEQVLQIRVGQLHLLIVRHGRRNRVDLGKSLFHHVLILGDFPLLILLRSRLLLAAKNIEVGH